MWTTDDNHGARTQFHSGRHMLDGLLSLRRRPDRIRGLGTLNENLPKFITMGPREFRIPRDGHYLGPAYDAVPLEVEIVKSRSMFGPPESPRLQRLQREMFGLVGRLDRLSAVRAPRRRGTGCAHQGYELAFRMQTAIPQILNFHSETRETQALYGFDDKVTRPFGMQLLAARRLVEQGARFVQIHAWRWRGRSVGLRHSACGTISTSLGKQVDQPGGRPAHRS